MTALTWLVVGWAWAGPVSLATADGVSLSGHSWGSGSRGVLLVPEEAGDHSAWSFVGERMSRGGLNVLAIDLRSRGATLAEADWPKLTGDVDAGVAWLMAHGATEVHVLGSGFGAVLALQAASTNQEVDDLVLLSPLMSARGLKVSASLPIYGPRPLLVETGDDDAIASRTATWIQTQATGPHEVHVRPGGGSGVAMFNTVPDLESTVVGWVNSILTKAEQDAREVKASEMGGIDTKGVRLEDRDH